MLGVNWAMLLSLTSLNTILPQRLLHGKRHTITYAYIFQINTDTILGPRAFLETHRTLISPTLPLGLMTTVLPPLANGAPHCTSLMLKTAHQVRATLTTTATAVAQAAPFPPSATTLSALATVALAKLALLKRSSSLFTSLVM